MTETGPRDVVSRALEEIRAEAAAIEWRERADQVQAITDSLMDTWQAAIDTPPVNVITQAMLFGALSTLRVTFAPALRADQIARLNGLTARCWEWVAGWVHDRLEEPEAGKR
ncbi:MAG TPA: hypothetical protein VMN39_01035 [Longimicrobiaceae bacterium]|nr:hypothetical protein [Longimicrobiaceae bacterium]